MQKQTSAWKGILAGMAGGLAASWVMNLFMAGANSGQPGSEPKEDATMKAADAVSHTVTGEHLSHEEKETGGPIVHYAFGVLTGGLYGGLAEFSPSVTAGFGTSFGGVLFSTADLLAVPALNLGPWPADQPPSALSSPFAAHIIYGGTTELVRRIVRRLL